MIKIMIIKLGALGDVVRTLPLAKALKEKYPDSEISWVTNKNAVEIVNSSPYVDKTLIINSEIKDEFDKLYNFDIDDEATTFTSKMNSKKKYGFYSEGGYPAAFNFQSEYYLNTLFDDDLKKKNTKTYQEMMFEVAELPYKKQLPKIPLSDKYKQYADEFLEINNLKKEKLIGVHIGASSRWPSKKWHKENLKNFIIKAKNKNYEIIIFGGPNEKKEHEILFKELSKKGIKIYRNNPDNSILEFASLINLCNFVVCSDSLALHISLALGKKTIGLFFISSPNEIEGYGLLKKIVSSSLKDFFPEKMDQYSEELTKSISSLEVLNTIEEINSKEIIKVVNAIIKHPLENKFLVIKRKNEEIHNGKWAFPGGIVELNESIEDALKREIKEEVGLDMKELVKKISEYSYKRPNGTQTFGTSYLVKVSDNKIIVNSEIEDFKWVTFEEFTNMNHIGGLDEELLEVISSPKE